MPVMLCHKKMGRTFPFSTQSELFFYMQRGRFLMRLLRLRINCVCRFLAATKGSGLHDCD